MKLEVHLTYRCNLACAYCNRACSLYATHTPDLHILQFRSILSLFPQTSKVVLIGGEPTLNPDLYAIASELINEHKHIAVKIYSNAYTESSRALLSRLAEIGIHNSGGTEKVHGSIKQEETTLFISPADMGYIRTTSCKWAAGQECGYSVDAKGVTACAIGGAIDGILGLNLRTWNKGEADRRLLELCRHCGAFWPYASIDPNDPRLHIWNGQVISDTWLNALKRMHGGGLVK